MLVQCQQITHQSPEIYCFNRPMQTKHSSSWFTNLL